MLAIPSTPIGRHAATLPADDERRSPPPQRSAKDLRQRGVSLYIQVADLFRHRIESGAWASGQRIPTILELAAECGAARQTIRQSLDILDQEGLIRRFRAKGTFVTGRAREGAWCELHRDFFALLDAPCDGGVEVLPALRDARLDGRPDFGFAAAGYRHLRRRHHRHGELYMIADVFIDERIAGAIPDAALSDETALRLMKHIPGLASASVDQIMTIGCADIDASEALHLPVNAPVAVVDRYDVDERGCLAVRARATFRADVVRLSAKFK